MIQLFLKEWRSHKGLTLDQLGERAGMHATTVSRLELQQTKWTSEQLEELALALDLDDPRKLLFEPK